MKTYTITPVRHAGSTCYRTEPEDPNAVWSVCSYDDETVVTQWMADASSQELAIEIVSILERESEGQKGIQSLGGGRLRRD